MDLLSKILECQTDEEADVIIKEEIDKMQNTTQLVEQLGFLDYGKCTSCYKGFIPLHTRIKYSNMNIEDYGMETTDFFYEFAHLLRKHKINNKGTLIHYMEYFINQYFGFPGKCDRETIFYHNAWNSAITDKEFFAALKNNKLGDLKGKGAAECTERGALAQQLLSLFKTESYYCIGHIEVDNIQEGHCFNIVKRKNDYALLDYSVPVEVYDSNGKLRAYYPFVGELSEEEFLEFTSNGVLKIFDNYQYVGSTKKRTGSSRKYVVGSYTIEKAKKM